MTADDDADPRQRPAQTLTIRLEDIDLDGFLVAADSAGGVEDLVAAFRQRVFRAGFTRANYVQVISNFERVPLASGERSLGGFDAPLLPPTRLVHFDPDPAMTRKLVELQTYTWRDLARTHQLGAEVVERIAEYAGAGFVDGVTIPVSLHEGDVAAFMFLRAGAIFDVPCPVMQKLQFFCQTMHARHTALAPQGAGSKLSKRETQVMTRVAVGKTNGEIAAELGISVHTVNTLVRRCFVKLGVSNRVEAATRMAYLTRER